MRGPDSLGCAHTISTAVPALWRPASHPPRLPCLPPSAPRRVTVAGVKGQGDVVNIEVEAQTQAIVDTVERVLQRYLEGGRLTQAQAAAR